MSKRRRRSRSAPVKRALPSDLAQLPDPPKPIVYQIRIKGHLEDRWTDWSDGLAVTLEVTGDTLLTVPVEDQAALHGLLRRLRDLGVSLISVNPASPGQPGNSSKEDDSQ